MKPWWKRGRVWAIGFALFVLAWATAAIYLAVQPDRVTLENYARIKKGMTRAEVRAILGKPWDDSLFDPVQPDVIREEEGSIGNLIDYNLPGSKSDFYRPTYWYGEGIVIGAVFDFDGHLIGKEQQRIPEPPQASVPERVWRRTRQRLGL